MKLFTGGETWVYSYDVETKTVIAVGGEIVIKSKKSMLPKLLKCVVDCLGVTHHEYILRGQTISKEVYLDIM